MQLPTRTRPGPRHRMTDQRQRSIGQALPRFRRHPSVVRCEPPLTYHVRSAKSRSFAAAKVRNSTYTCLIILSQHSKLSQLGLSQASSYIHTDALKKPWVANEPDGLSHCRHDSTSPTAKGSHFKEAHAWHATLRCLLGVIPKHRTLLLLRRQ